MLGSPYIVDQKDGWMENQTPILHLPKAGDTIKQVNRDNLGMIFIP